MGKNRLLAQIFAVVTIGLGIVIVSNYQQAYNLTIANTVKSELPLTGDTVYSEIQNDLIRPVYVSSEMANDAFLRDWVLGGEKDQAKIVRYLREVSQKHGLVTCFFVSARTSTYYFPGGVLKKVSPRVSADGWFYRVAEMPQDFEMNVDADASHSNQLTVFINVKVYDYDGNFIGATGLGLPLSHVMKAVERYSAQFGRRIYLVDKSGNIVVQASGAPAIQGNIFTRPGISVIAKEILDSAMHSDSRAFEYKGERGNTTRLNARYIPELGWHLVVEKDDEPNASVVITGILGGVAISIIMLGILGGLYLLASRRRSRFLAHKAEMLAVVSHDLRHFLHTLYILLSSASASNGNQKRRWAVGEMEKVVEGLDELITKFLSYYRLDAGADVQKFSSVRLSSNLEQLVREIGPQLEQTGRQVVLPDYDDRWVWTDPVLLKIILRNFLSNALKYADRGDVRISVVTLEAKGLLKISVVDEGKDLTTEDVRKLFKKFARDPGLARAKGEGLGLFMVEYYAKKLGCRVGVERGEPTGNCFWISVPLADANAAQKAEEAERAALGMINHLDFPLKGRTIALVDTERAAAALLEKWGARLLRYDSCGEYLDNAPGGEPVIAIFMEDRGELLSDEGRALLVRIRLKVGEGVPIIVLGVRSPDEISGLRLPKDLHYLQKPVKPVRLRHLINGLAAHA